MSKWFSFILAASVLSAGIGQAGTVDVGSGNNGKKTLAEEVGSLIALNTRLNGNILKSTKNGEIITREKCSVIASIRGDELVVDMNRTRKSKKGSFAFQAKNDGSDLLLEPSYMNPDGAGIELSIINNFASATQNLVIRTNETGAVVSVTKKADSEFDVAPESLSCALTR